jgi:hypothetical protein
MKREDKQRISKKLNIVWEPEQVSRMAFELDLNLNIDPLVPDDAKFGLAFHGFQRGGFIGMVVIFVRLGPNNQHVRHVLTLPEEEGELAKDYLEGLMNFLVGRAAMDSGADQLEEISGYVPRFNTSNN